MLSTLGKILSRCHFENYFSFLFFSPRKQNLTFHAKCMKCLILFSGKNVKYISNLSSAELAERVVEVKYGISQVASSFI